jgi:hypothetical protein
MSAMRYSRVRPALAESDLTAIAPYMFWLMFRNVASDGLVFEDPERSGVLSQPGCVLASPSWENTATHVSQDYVYNWTRDAAVVAIELAAGPLPSTQPLIDYVRFAQACQVSGSALGHFDRASFLINATMRDSWTDQTDGPALQTLALLQLFGQLDAPTQAVADAVIAANLNFLNGAYTDGAIPFDDLSAGFFGQVGIGASATPAAAAAALQAAGDQMLQAVVFHSDHLELSEQFDAATGYEKSVSNLSWSYASFLSAVRARSAV